MQVVGPCRRREGKYNESCQRLYMAYRKNKGKEKLQVDTIVLLLCQHRKFMTKT